MTILLFVSPGYMRVARSSACFLLLTEVFLSAMLCLDGPNCSADRVLFWFLEDLCDGFF
jgi:hypothetical protein